MQIYHISTSKGLKLQRNQACSIMSIFFFFQFLHSNYMRLCITSYIRYFLKIQTWKLCWWYIATFHILFFIIISSIKVFLQVWLNLQGLVKVFNLQSYLKNRKSDPKIRPNIKLQIHSSTTFISCKFVLLFIYLSVYL